MFIYYEAYISYDLARRAERFYKTGKGREVLKEKLQVKFVNEYLVRSAGGSSNGRTAAFEAVYDGSNPSPPALCARSSMGLYNR